jgi:hypothetical protein
MNARFDIARPRRRLARLVATAIGVALAAVATAPAWGQGPVDMVASIDRAKKVATQAKAAQHAADLTPATVAPAATVPSASAPATLTVSAPAKAPAAAPTPATAAAVPDEAAASAKAASAKAAPASSTASFLAMAKSAIGLDDAAKLGLESDDKPAASATDLMKNPEIQRLLGDRLRFTYDSNGLQDPMMVPWVRNAAIFGELNAAAEAAVQANQLDKATEFYKRVLALGDARYTDVVTGKLTEIAGKKNAQAMALLASNPQAAVDLPVELPNEVRESTTAVLVGSGQPPQCLVGSDMLGVGQTVPKFPNVRVASIEKDKVVFQVKNKTFEVNLGAIGAGSEQAAKGVK